jgi:hypothetical protein
MQKTELKSEIKRARNGQNNTKQRFADCPLQYHGQSATVPQTARYITWTVRSSRIRNQTPRKQFYSWSEKPLLQSPDSPGLGAGQSASTDTEQQRTHRKEPDSRTVHYSTPDCPRIVQTEEQERPQNRLLTSIFRFVAKPSPTTTKLGEHNHKTVGELFLRGHCPI